MSVPSSPLPRLFLKGSSVVIVSSTDLSGYLFTVWMSEEFDDLGDNLLHTQTGSTSLCTLSRCRHCSVRSGGRSLSWVQFLGLRADDLTSIAESEYTALVWRAGWTDYLELPIVDVVIDWFLLEISQLVVISWTPFTEVKRWNFNSFFPRICSCMKGCRHYLENFRPNLRKFRSPHSRCVRWISEAGVPGGALDGRCVHWGSNGQKIMN